MLPLQSYPCHYCHGTAIARVLLVHHRRRLAIVCVQPPPAPCRTAEVEPVPPAAPRAFAEKIADRQAAPSAAPPLCFAEAIKVLLQSRAWTLKLPSADEQPRPGDVPMPPRFLPVVCAGPGPTAGVVADGQCLDVPPWTANLSTLG